MISNVSSEDPTRNWTVSKDALRWCTILVAISIIVQVTVAVSIWKIRDGKELASDLVDYVDYVQKPFMLFHSMADQETTGGRFASPLEPLMLIGPYTLFDTVFDQFLSFRFTMIAWLNLGLWLALKYAFDVFGAPETLRQKIAATCLLLTPVFVMGSAVLSQDDCVAAGWSGICLWAWRRWGPWGCTLSILMAFWCAKIFFAVGLLGLWITYPKLRLQLIAVGVLLIFASAGFLLWRDGTTNYVNSPIPPYMGGSIYAIYFIFFVEPTFKDASYYTGLFRTIALVPTMVGLGAWALLGLKRPISLPASIVGTYSIFFAFFAAMMPEYEYWYIAWVALIMWSTVKSGDWLTFGICWSHSFWGYLYKILYSSDSTIFHKGVNGSILQGFFRQHFNFDLKWLLVFSASATVLSALWLAVRLYQNDPTSSIRSQKVAQ